MAGSRTWASLYQGRPSPESGDLFLREQWQRYDQPLWLVRDDGARIVPGLERSRRRADPVLGHDVQGHRRHRLRGRAGLVPPRRRLRPS